MAAQGARRTISTAAGMEMDMAKKSDGTAAPKPMEIRLGEPEPDTLRAIGGSKSDRFNNALIHSVIGTGWFRTGLSDEDRSQQIFVAVTGLQAFKPADEIEAMLAAQAMVAHHAAMECSRRAMLPDQPFEAAQGLRKAAANASRTFIELVAALDRRHGKGGQQVVRVEHVHVHSGGKAIVGSVAQGPGGGGGVAQKQPKNPRRTTDWRMHLSLAQSCPRCGARTRSGSSCRSPAMPNGR
jgi:ribosomal protein L32